MITIVKSRRPEQFLFMSGGSVCKIFTKQQVLNVYPNPLMSIGNKSLKLILNIFYGFWLRVCETNGTGELGGLVPI